MTVLLGLLHRLAGQSAAYDLIQSLAGVGEIHRRLATRFQSLGGQSVVVDLAGGTGTLRRLFPEDAIYCCLDNEIAKLAGFRRKYPRGVAVLGDVTQAPVRSEGVDMVTGINMAHHLSDELVSRFLAEAQRMLKPGGRFVLVDPLWAPERWAGRLLWKLDRGSHPRTAESLATAVSRYFRIAHTERFAVYHEYALFIASK